MFRREIRVKSNTQLKRTEVKSLKENILRCYPNLTEQIMNEIFPKKEATKVVKVLTATNETVLVYTVQSKPTFFYLKDVLLPSVYLLWKLPNMLIEITIHRMVWSHINNGADVMTPGVIIPPQKYGYFALHTPAYINTNLNKAAVAVGLTTMTSAEVIGNVRGKCVQVYHYYGDKLCTLDHLRIEHPPDMGPPSFMVMPRNKDEFPMLGGALSPPRKKPENVPKEAEENAEGVTRQVEYLQLEDCSQCGATGTVNKQAVPNETMDDLVLRSFLTVLKYSRSLSLPILTSNFYKQMTMCFPGKSVDVKKSSYKKISQFLQKMCEDGFIAKKEVKKGVEAITSINKEHPKFIEFYLDPSERPISENTEGAASGPNVAEGYIITAPVVPIFREFGLQKGEIIAAPDISQYVTHFIKIRGYQDPEDRELVHVKEELTNVCKGQSNVGWAELMEKVRGAMKPCYSVSTDRFMGDVNKGKLEVITMRISSRSSNKKVTLVDNLELYGISIRDFAKECQHGVAASTTINQVPGKKSQQLLVQGNQINFINKQLREVYKIPAKYIRGAELGLKK